MTGEVFLERPKIFTVHAQTWSNYKYNNTAKYLIGVTPSGSFMFLSPGWGGSFSDKQISVDSGLFDEISMGDCILVNKGFTFKEELVSLGATLNVPHFTKEKAGCLGRKLTLQGNYQM